MNAKEIEKLIHELVSSKSEDAFNSDDSVKDPDVDLEQEVTSTESDTEDDEGIPENAPNSFLLPGESKTCIWINWTGKQKPFTFSQPEGITTPYSSESKPIDSIFQIKNTNMVLKFLGCAIQTDIYMEIFNIYWTF